jgi:prophage tail gpP-like protein
MATPQEICTVTANGQNYNIWESVEVVKSAEDVIDHCMLTVSEISTGGSSLSQLKLAPGDTVTVTLGGMQAMNGLVYLRQAAYDANVHAVQIGICSTAQDIMRTSVDGAPGQYLNQTIQQIGSACFGKVGVGFNIVGGPSGANTIFPRVSETIGQSRFSFIENLCRLRNLHMIDDGHGNIEAYRGPQGSSAPLQEGVNILKARLLLKNDEFAQEQAGLAQNFKQGAPGAQISASASVNNPVGATRAGTNKFPAENASDQASLQMRVNQEVDHVNYKTVDGVITVQGWFLSSGDLWMNHVRQSVTVNSPMLIPQGSDSFIIKEVAHRQSSAEGTTTDIMITNINGLGANEQAGPAGP